MVDRQTLTVRTLMVAALGVLLVAPEAVVHPSFQMSFAATLALVAGYQQGLPWMSRSADTPLSARIALWGGREVAGLIIVSLLAGTATIPYVAYHFHRISSYGVLANLLAMPVVSAWVMPMGILGMIALPFGLDGYCWKLMGAGIDWMVAIALWVTSLPGAVGRMAAFGVGPLLIGTAGLMLLCLLKTPLRLVGLALIGWATVMAVQAPQPDVLVAPEGTAFAIRTPDGRLAMVKSGSDTFAFRSWLMADADPRDPKDKSLSDGIRCDPAGCVARLADNLIIAIANSVEAFAEDCRRAAVVLSVRDAPPGCSALVIDRQATRRTGAVMLRRVGDRFEMTVSRPPGYDRPWAPARPETDEPSRPSAARTQPRDATPNIDDLEPGD
jgi:competence protein ComEC